MIITLGQNALKTTALLAGPLLLGALVTGLLISIFQAITQINEATLTFIPKMLVTAAIIILAGPWMLEVLTHFTAELFENLPTMVRN